MTRTELLHPSPRRDAATVIRSVTAAAGLLVRRRARRDLGLLLVLLALVGAASLLASLSPGLVVRAVDDGARDAVARAGAEADVVVHVFVGQRTATTPDFTPADQVLALAAAIPSRLPSGVATVYSATTVTVASPEFSASTTGSALGLRVGMLTPANTADLHLVNGSMPSDQADSPIEVLVSTAADLPLGTVITPESGDETFLVVGTVEPAADAAWRDLPTLFTPQTTTNSAGGIKTALTVLTSTAGVARAEGVVADPWSGDIRLVLDPASFTGVLEAQVAREVNGLRANGGALAGDSGATVRVSSEFSTALLPFQPQARAAVAQMSVMFAGMLGVACIVVVLLSRLIVSRRSAELVLERARGASLVAIAVRDALESVVVAALGATVGYIAAFQLAPGAPDPFWTVVVGLVAAAGIPLQSVFSTRASTAVRRVAANRGDRLDVVRRAQTRRLVIELTLVAIAVGALVSVRSRGLLQTRTDGIDPLLAAAPLLLAVIVTIVLLRVFPLVIRLAAAAGRRTTGPLGVLGAAHAERAIAVLPLASLTLAVALAVGGGLLVDTVHAGQVDASWQRVGADVRVTGAISPAEAARVADAEGVTASSAMLVADGITVSAGTTSAIVSVLAVDDGYRALVAALPTGEGAGASTGIESLDLLGSADDALPVVVDATLAARLASGDLVMAYGTENVRLQIVGTLDAGPDGWSDGPHLWVDLAALQGRLPALPGANTLLAVGPGAEAAVAGLDETLARSAWISDREQLPLVAGVRAIMAISAAAACLFALIALLASVLGSARLRGRSLAMLRTLGMSPRLGWWIALAEIGPVVIVAAIGGVISGVAMILAIGPSLGLQSLAGGLAEPAPSLSPTVILAVVGGLVTLLGAALVTEAAVRRRDRLSEVLRVGETV